MATPSLQLPHPADIPFFVTTVDTTGPRMKTLKIPATFRELHLATDDSKEAVLKLVGLPHNAWKVDVVEADNDKFLGVGWEWFVRLTCGVQPRVVLVLKYQGCMTFSVIRFGYNGQVLYFLPWLTATNPWNRLDQIYENFQGFAVTAWGPGNSPASIGYGSLFNRLVGDGAVMGKITFQMYRNEGPYWMTEAIFSSEGLFFGHGWQHFVDAIALDRNKCAVFKYLGYLAFSVIVFDMEFGTVVLPNMHDPRIGGSEEWLIEPSSIEAGVGHSPKHAGEGMSNQENPVGDVHNELAEVLPFPENVAALSTCLLTIQRGHGAFPTSFAKFHLGGRPSSLTLQKATGGTWPVTTAATNGTLYVSRGYAKFKKDNKFKTGDLVRVFLVGEGTLEFN